MSQIEFQGTERFEVKRRLGEGGIGVVYEAYDHERKQSVALKTLKRLDGDGLFRFKKEFRALHDIDHPNLIGIYEFIEENDAVFFTMELISGADFLSYVRDTRDRQRAESLSATSEQKVAPRYSETKLRAALKQLAQGIAALHAAGMVHRDIKPSKSVSKKSE